MSRILRRLVPASLVAALVVATLGPADPGPRGAMSPASVDPKSIKTASSVAGLPSACDEESDGRIVCTYGYTGAVETLVVPAGATQIRYTAGGAAGANGGGSGQGGNVGGAGGGGDEFDGALTDAAGRTLRIGVGNIGNGRGEGGDNPMTTYQNLSGGDGGNGKTDAGAGGRGGAATIIGWETSNDSNVYVIAGGGGGGSGGSGIAANDGNPGNNGGSPESTNGGARNGGNGGTGDGTTGSGGGGGGGGFPGGAGGSAHEYGRGDGGQGGKSNNFAGATIDSKHRARVGGAGIVKIAWYRSAPTYSVSMPSDDSAYAYQSGAVSVSLHLPTSAGGTADVYDNNTSVCTGVAVSSGVATCSLSGNQLYGGSHQIRFTYNGDGGYSPVYGINGSFHVAANPVTSTVSATKQDDGTYTLAATVAPAASHSDGVVDGTLSLGVTTAAGTGVASCADVSAPSPSVSRAGRSLTNTCNVTVGPGFYKVRSKFVGNAGNTATPDTQASDDLTVDQFQPTVSLDLGDVADNRFGGTSLATVTVAAPEGATSDPGGSVTVAPSDGRSGPSCSDTAADSVVSRVATFTCTITPNAGQQSLVATYSGDTAFASGTSSSQSLTIDAATPTVTITAPSSTVTAKDSVTLTLAATVGSADVTSGTLTVREGDREVGSVDLAQHAGGGTVTDASLVAGRHSYRVSYSAAGRGSNYSSDANAANLTITAAPLAATLAVDTAVDTEGMTGSGFPVTVTSTLTVPSSDDATGTFTVDPQGQCTTSSDIEGGTRTFTCTYLLGAGETPSFTVTYTDPYAGTVTTTATAKQLPASPVRVQLSAVGGNYGTQPDLGASIYPSVSGTVVDGSVEVFVDGTSACTGAVVFVDNTYKASCRGTFLPHAGTHTVSATFTPSDSGKARVEGGSSITRSLFVGRAPASIALSAAPDSSDGKDELVVVATATADEGSQVPTGSVRFGSDLDACGTTPLVAGKARCVVDLPASGTKSSLRAILVATDDFTNGDTTDVSTTYQRQPKGECVNGFDKLWSAAAKGGTFALDAGGLGTVSFTPRGNLGTCDASALLGGTADASLFGGTLTTTKAKVTLTSTSFCFTDGSFTLPSDWKTSALAVTEAVCFPITNAGANGGLGAPTQGTLARSDSGGTGAPLLSVPGVTGPASMSARFGTACPKHAVGDSCDGDATAAVTITGVVAAVGSAPGVTVAATVRGDGSLRASVASTSIAVLGTSVALGGTITRDGTGPRTVDVTGTTTAVGAPASGLVLDAGATLRLVDGTIGDPSYQVTGTVRAGASGAQLALALSGSVTSLSSYSLDLTGSGSSTWTPIAGLGLSPTLAGHLTKSGDGASFSVTATGTDATPLTTWRPLNGATVTVTGVSLGAAAAQKCSLGDSGGVLAVDGKIELGDLSTPIKGCVTLADQSWRIAATSTSATLGRLTLSSLVLDASKQAGGAATLAGSATATLPIGTGGTASVTLHLQDGAFVVGGQLDATGLGLPTKYAYLAYASKAVADWQTGLGSRGLGAGGLVDLPAGLSLVGAVPLPSAVVTVLRQAKFTLAAGAVLTFVGTVPPTGSSIVFRTDLGTPSGMPLLTLPSGTKVTSAAVSYTGGRFALVADGTVSGQDGKAAPIHLAVSIADDGSLDGSASVTGLGLFGRSVDLSGAVSRTADGTFRAAVSGSVSGSVTLGGVSVRNVRVAIGPDGLGATGTLTVASVSVPFSASLASTSGYSLQVRTTVNDWTPVRGVTVDATFAGALTKSSKGYTYDFTATPVGDAPLVSITPATGVTLGLTTLRLNDTAAAPSGCTLADSDDAWLGAAGSVTLATGPAKGSGSGSGCFDLSHPSFALTATLPGKDLGNSDAGVDIGNLTVKISRGGTGNFGVSAQTRISVQMITGGQFSAVVPVVFGTKGFAIGGKANLTNFLGDSAAQAYLFLSYTKLTVETGDDAIGSLALSPGVTVGIAFTVGGELAKALKTVGVPIGAGSTLAATVQLDPKAKSVKLRVGLAFESTNLFTLNNGTYLRLDDMALAMTIAPSASPNFAFETDATLHLPATVPGGSASDVALRGAIRIGTELTTYLSVSDWHDAMGLRGLELDNFTLQGGVTLTGLPLPSLAASASVSGLPSTVASAIGYRQGAPMSLTLAVGETNLLVDVTIGTKGSQTVALAPFDAFGRADLLSVNYAELYLSPTGATVGDRVYPAGFALAFQGKVVGVAVDVLAKVDPVRQTMNFRGTVGTISVGSLVMGPTTLTIDAAPRKFDMSFTGHVAIGPSTTQIGPALRLSGNLSADITLGVGTSGINALLNFSASVSSSDYLPQSTCYDDGIWKPCNYRWVDTTPLTIKANNVGFDLNASGFTVHVPNTLSNITFPWPKSATSDKVRSLTGRGTGIQAITARQLNVPIALAPARTAVAAGSWQRTGSLGTRRVVSASLPLRDGRIMTIGGTAGKGRALSTVEIYDAKTGGWHGAASMAVPRINPSAVELKDGRVLVVGGDTGRGETAAAEIFDPRSGRWSDAGALSTGRQSASLAVLADGSVLVVGGHVHGSPTTTVDRYDPKTGAWHVAAALPEARASAASAVLADGSVLVVGGLGRRGPLASAVRYDSGSDTWHAVAPMAHARFYASAVPLDDGSVLVAGGASGAERYLPASGTWTSAGSLAGPTLLAATVKLVDGDVLVTGGLGADGSLTQTDRYDASAHRWTSGAALPGPRAAAAAALLPSGDVLVAGGLNDHSARADAVVYRTDGGTALPTAAFVPASVHSSGPGVGTWIGIGLGALLLAAGVVLLLLLFSRRRIRRVGT